MYMYIVHMHVYTSTSRGQSHLFLSGDKVPVIHQPLLQLLWNLNLHLPLWGRVSLQGHKHATFTCVFHTEGGGGEGVLTPPPPPPPTHNSYMKPCSLTHVYMSRGINTVPLSSQGYHVSPSYDEESLSLK